jgi:hypothetical protein
MVSGKRNKAKYLYREFVDAALKNDPEEDAALRKLSRR